jgi:hypothetical protein
VTALGFRHCFLLLLRFLPLLPGELDRWGWLVVILAFELSVVAGRPIRKKLLRAEAVLDLGICCECYRLAATTRLVARGSDRPDLLVRALWISETIIHCQLYRPVEFWHWVAMIV